MVHDGADSRNALRHNRRPHSCQRCAVSVPLCWRHDACGPALPRGYLDCLSPGLRVSTVARFSPRMCFGQHYTCRARVVRRERVDSRTRPGDRLRYHTVGPAESLGPQRDRWRVGASGGCVVQLRSLRCVVRGRKVAGPPPVQRGGAVRFLLLTTDTHGGSRSGVEVAASSLACLVVRSPDSGVPSRSELMYMSHLLKRSAVSNAQRRYSGSGTVDATTNEIQRRTPPCAGFCGRAMTAARC